MKKILFTITIFLLLISNVMADEYKTGFSSVPVIINEHNSHCLGILIERFRTFFPSMILSS